MPAGVGLKDAWATRLDANDTSAKEELGILRFEIDPTEGLKGYIYVQAASDTTVANGTALAFVDKFKRQVTSGISDANRNQPAGVGIGAIAASSYGWIQVYGYHEAVKTNGDDDIADGDSVILSASDGVADSVASGTAPTHKILGVAVAADDDTNDTVETFLECL